MSRVVHFEIHADQPERAKAFYTALLGWQFAKWEGGPFEYYMIITGPEGTPGINGGLMKRQHPISGTDGVIAFVCTVPVENVDASMAKAVELGGKIALPKQPITGVGVLAYVKDTEGNVIGLLQPEMPAKA